MKDRIALGWGAVALLIHLAVANRYGFFRDELYFIVCGQHPSFGYVDQPPLVPLLAAGSYALGHHLVLVRLIPALLSAAVVIAAIAFARLFGARDGAAHLTGVTVATAPMFLGLNALFDTTVFEPLAWTLVALCVARAALRDDKRALVWAGVTAGIALEAKYGIVVWLVALAIGCAFTPLRALFARRGLYVGAALCVAIAAPSLIWQALHGFPFAELVHAAGRKNAHVSPLEFLVGQVVVMNPLAAPVWISGIVAPFVRKDLRDARAFAIAFVITIAATIAGGGKDYYTAAAYPIAFALGAVTIERILAVGFRTAYAVAIAVLAAVASPQALPVLPPSELHGYLATLHMARPSAEREALGQLPQVFADEFGWRELAATVADVYDALPAADRKKAYVITGNYGDAAAIDVFDAGRGLPPTLSGHNQYYLWGPHGYDGSVLIDVGATVADDRKICKSATLAATFSAAYVMPYENHMGIVICRGLKVPVARIWPKQKMYM